MTLSFIDGIALLACFREGANLAGLFSTALRSSRNSPDSTRDQPLTIVIPVFEEESIIEQTCLYFARIIKGRPACELVICGTVRERRGTINPTLAKARQVLDKVQNCRVIESPNKMGSKAEQLQFAFESRQVEPGRYFAIYDVDSRPTARVIDEFNYTVAASGAPVIQQHALFLGNLPEIAKRPLQVGQALYQSRWTLAHEVPRFILYRLGVTPFVHLVGHGLFIDQNVIERFRGFPTGTIVDDAHMGLFVSASRLDIRSLRTFDISDNPASLKETYKQLFGWSRGPLDISEYLASYGAAGFRISIFRSFYIKLAAYAYWIQWIWTTPAIVILIWAAAVGNHIAAVWIMMYALDFLFAFGLLRHMFVRSRMPNALYGLFAMTMFAALCSLPAFAALGAKILGIRTKKYKTSHRSL